MLKMCAKYVPSFLLIIHFFHIVYAINHSLEDSYHPQPTPLIKSYENVLKMSLKSLYNEDGRENNDTAQSALLTQNCSSAFDQFSNAIVNLTRCAVKYARPVHICFECGNAFKLCNETYNDLRKQGKDCDEYFFSSDKVAIVDALFKDATQLWSNNYCQNCYLNLSLTEDFFNLSRAFLNCVLNPNKTEFLPANTTCEKCHNLYTELSKKYGLFATAPEDYEEICMDVIDTMNITRRIWKDYNCMPTFDYSLGYPNIVVALAVGVTPVLFYLLAKNISIIEDVKIVRPKRKFTPAVSTIQPLKD